ncbi:WXG100 family type VII secretion target [Allorhizocola rhizosphaerae]|uniref:WXG100 family type VII secretion target n=1 Tax=Allorhizocola rhizosphaerae TaxID=1872709 RepID=UPI0013C35B49|nr:WXG100 family type VII secretion target [Allorhizocola rhizosphaerae]
MSANPMVAARQEGPKDPWAGVWLAEDIALIHQGVKNGNWVDGTLGGVSAGLDTLALAVDPAGVLLQYGISWPIEYVKPLSDALDWLAGDPAQITAHAQTWRNVAHGIQGTVDELAGATTQNLAVWQGSAADAYRSWTAEQHQAITSLAKAAEAMAAITEGAAALVAAVRMLVRDAIATVVSRLIVYAAEELFTLGAATPMVAKQATALVAAWAAKIARWLKALLASFRRLKPVFDRLGEIIRDLKENLNRLNRKESGPSPSGPTPPPPQKIGGPAHFDPEELRGLPADQVRAMIPDDWIRRPSADGGGEAFVDPVNRGRQIRIMPGYPPDTRADPMTWGPYAVVSQNGQTVKVPLAGNPTLP